MDFFVPALIVIMLLLSALLPVFLCFKGIFTCVCEGPLYSNYTLQNHVKISLI